MFQVTNIFGLHRDEIQPNNETELRRCSAKDLQYFKEQGVKYTEGYEKLKPDDLEAEAALPEGGRRGKSETEGGAWGGERGGG